MPVHGAHDALLLVENAEGLIAVHGVARIQSLKAERVRAAVGQPTVLHHHHKLFVNGLSARLVKPYEPPINITILVTIFIRSTYRKGRSRNSSRGRKLTV